MVRKRSLKIIFLFFILMILIGQNSSSLFYVTYPGVPVYASADETSKIIHRLSYGTSVLVDKKEQESWYQIQLPKLKIKGWMRSYFLLDKVIDPSLFVHPTYHYSLALPKDWVVNAMSEDWLYFKPSKALLQPIALTIRVSQTSSTSLKELALEHPLSIRYQKEQLDAQEQGKNLFIKKEESTKLNGQEAFSFHFFAHKHQNDKTSTLEAKQYLLLSSGQLYAIMMAAPKEQFAKYKPIFEETLKTLKFQK